MSLAKALRPITQREALADYSKLKEVAPGAESLNKRTGLKALDMLFFDFRLQARTKSGLSFAAAVQQPRLRQKLGLIAERYNAGLDVGTLDKHTYLKKLYQAFQIHYGAVAQFRPVVARWVYATLRPRVGVLDFSAGWGGRCLAAMSMGIPYIGIDANTDLEGAYNEMVKRLAPRSRVHMVFQPAETVDFAQYRGAYDLVFTSPPYYNKELYRNAPSYPSRRAFLRTFFRPVVKNAWDNLMPGGHMALNIPHDLFAELAKFKHQVVKQLKMPLRNRPPSHRNKSRRYEFIYVWKKPVLKM